MRQRQVLTHSSHILLKVNSNKCFIILYYFLLMDPGKTCFNKLYIFQKSSPLFGSHSFCPLGGWNLALRSSVFVCVHPSWLKGGVVTGVDYCKKAHNFQTDSQTCTRFSGQVGHEPKDSWLIVRTDWQKGGRGSGSGPYQNDTELLNRLM